MGVTHFKKMGEKIDLQNNHLDLGGIYRTLYPTMANRYSSQLYPVMFSNKDHKTSLNKSKRTENTQNIFSNNNKSS